MYRSLLCLFTFLAAPVVANAADDFKLESGFTLLFNGKDLSGWKVAPNKDKDKSGDSLEGKAESPTKRFVVTDGVIVIDGNLFFNDATTTERLDSVPSVRPNHVVRVAASSALSSSAIDTLCLCETKTE